MTHDGGLAYVGGPMTQSETTYVDESGQELTAEEFHQLMKSRVHGEEGLKQLETHTRQSFKVGPLVLSHGTAGCITKCSTSPHHVE